MGARTGGGMTERKHISAHSSRGGMWIQRGSESVALIAAPVTEHIDEVAVWVTAWNAAIEINPANPIAAAEALPALLAACKAAFAALDQNKTFPADIAAA